jgi:hypothetical protein
MSKKHHGGPGPIPPGNRPKGGRLADDVDDTEKADEAAGAPFNDQDPKRRLGGYGGAGEHPRQQPGPLNDGGQQSR